jgi:hypothetical protein
VITAVDSSVLLDVLTDAPTRAAASLEALRRALRSGPIVACPVVWAEVRAFFADVGRMNEAFASAGIAFDAFDEDSSNLAGAIWQLYRRQGGRRTRLVADFLIGAHAQVRAARLLTRDRGFFRRYFRELEVMEPAL